MIVAEAMQDQRRHDMRALAREPMTADEFLYAYEGIEGRWELVAGVPVMMAGGTMRHGDVAANILTALRNKLRGKGCKAFGSDVGIHVDLYQIRYPDASVLCDPRDIGVDALKAARFPIVVFEVLSPSTRGDDFGLKLPEYKSLESARAIVIVNAETETSELFERVGGREWRKSTIEQGKDLNLAAIALTLSAEDIFRRD